MAKLGGFRTTAQRDAYVEVYDRILDREWPVDHDELDLTTSYGTTRVRRSQGGGATPLVMLHPTTGSGLGWYPLVEPLCRDRAVLTPDTVGTCGRSVQTAPIGSVHDLAIWVDEVLDALALERVHLLGYSEGGWIAASHAALTSRADRLASVTLIEPAGAIARIPAATLASLVGRAVLAMAARDRTAALVRFNRWMNGDVQLTPGQVELLEVSMGSFRQHLPTPGRLGDDELRRITMPVLLLMARDTRIYDPDEVARRAERLLADVTVHVTPDAGHGLWFQYPEAVTARINAFLRAHD